MTEACVGFTRVLRGAGLQCGPDRVQAFLRATAHVDLYWAGRLTLCADPDDLPDTLYLSDGQTNAVEIVRQAAVDAPPLRYVAPVTVTEAGAFVRLPLPPEAYAKSRDGALADLRVVDASGARVISMSLSVKHFSTPSYAKWRKASEAIAKAVTPGFRMLVPDATGRALEGARFFQTIELRHQLLGVAQKSDVIVPRMRHPRGRLQQRRQFLRRGDPDGGVLAVGQLQQE